MLDNEPTGGSTVGENPTVVSAETTTVQKPVRRRATRRAGAAVATESTTPDTPSTSENTQAEAAEPDAVKAPAKRATRTRKKAAPTAVTDDTQPTDDAPAAADAAPVAESAPADAEPAKTPAKRASRSRKKAAAAVEPVAEAAVVVEPLTDEADEVDPAAEEEPLTATPTLVAPPVVMFMAPDPVVAITPTSRVVNPFAPPVVEEEAPAPAKRSRSRRKAAAAETEPVAEESAEVSEVADAPGDTEIDAEDEESAERRRRRRGRRGRGRGRGGDELGEGEEGSDDAAEQDDAAGTDTTEADSEADGDDDTAEGGTRRRRRRRRRGSSGGDAELAPDDPPNTVVRVRDTKAAETRSSFEDEVQGVKGSTRLEAKRQRRRDGRDQGRRRPPVLSEAEFLARREAVERVMVVRQQGERTQIAVLEDDILVEHYVTKASSASYAGNVYLGKVQNVLPSMEAAFVDIGKGRNAVLYAGEVNWDSAGMAGKPRKIEQALRSGDPVLVQVTKDPIGHKGARLTSQISLPGRFLVYVPEGQMTGISRKLPENERKRLKDILKKIVPENAGVIIRTAAEGASEEELARDVARLEAQWQSIKAKADKGNAPALLHAEPDLVIRVIRDIFNEDFSKLVVQGNDGWETVQQYVEHVSPDLVERLSRHTGESDVFHDLRIDEQLTKALDRKVFLPSGGSLVIDRTEAMTVVDVNTGKFTGQGGNLEETVTRNNLEAAEEIVRQLRLRDIGGIIVIDFIDMVLEGNRDLVLRRLTECLGRDRTKHQVAEVTSLGLVQMTRKRVGQGLLEVFSETCEHCRGRGIIVRSEPVGERPKPAQPALPAAPGGAAAVAEPKSRKRRSGRGRGGDAEQLESVPSPSEVADAIANGNEPNFDDTERTFEDAVPDSTAPVEQAPSLNGSASAGRNLSRGGERGRAARHRVDQSDEPQADAHHADERHADRQQVAAAEAQTVESEPVAAESAVVESAVADAGVADAGVADAVTDSAAVEPAVVEQESPAVEQVATVPAPRKRTRRAASRPAGPPPAAG